MIAQQIYIFCKDPACERRLHLPEEWTTGLCMLHAVPGAETDENEGIDWNAILERIDASDPRKTGTPPYRQMNRDA